MALLEMGYSFFQRLGNLGGHFVTEEGDLGSLCRVDEGSIPLKLVEESP
jgi:hypothetical protein